MKGLLHCWMQTPGQGFQVDGMQTLYPKLREADVWVLATPVHLDGMSEIGERASVWFNGQWKGRPRFPLL